MKRILPGLVLALFVFGAVLSGCTQKAASSQEAIEQSKNLATVEQQADYLISQSNAFLNSDEFNEAITTAQYVLRNLDQNSTEARTLIEKAKAEMKKAADAAANDIKKSIGDLGQ